MKKPWKTPAVVTLEPCCFVGCGRLGDASGYCLAHSQRGLDAKERLRRAQVVLAAYVDGEAVTVTAQRLAVSRTLVWKLRAWLGVETGRHGGRVRGTRDTKAAILAVRE